MKKYAISIFAATCLSVSALSHAAIVNINFNSLTNANIGVGDAYAINAFTTLSTDGYVGIGPGIFDSTITAIGAAGSTALFTFDTTLVNVTSITLGGTSNNVPVTVTTFDLNGAQVDTIDTSNSWTELVALSSASPISYFSVRLLESEISRLSFTYADVASGSGGNGGGVSTVPVPAAVWLFGSGLVGLVGAFRRKRA